MQNYFVKCRLVVKLINSNKIKFDNCTKIVYNRYNVPARGSFIDKLYWYADH